MTFVHPYAGVGGGSFPPGILGWAGAQLWCCPSRAAQCPQGQACTPAWQAGVGLQKWHLWGKGTRFDCPSLLARQACRLGPGGTVLLLRGSTRAVLQPTSKSQGEKKPPLPPHRGGQKSWASQACHETQHPTLRKTWLFFAPPPPLSLPSGTHVDNSAALAAAGRQQNDTLPGSRRSDSNPRPPERKPAPVRLSSRQVRELSARYTAGATLALRCRGYK
jgi:hypothetical protein